MRSNTLHTLLIVLLCDHVQSRAGLGRAEDVSNSLSQANGANVRTRLRIPRVEAAGYAAYRQIAIPFAERGADEGKGIYSQVQIDM
jgi:hypothetical protein